MPRLRIPSRPPSRSRRRAISVARAHAFVLGSWAVASLLATGLGCGTGDEEARGGPPPTPVVVSSPFEYEFADRVEALGTAQANESVEITAKITETVESLRFRDGQEVEAGTVLAVFQDDEVRAQLAGARANLADAQLRFDRVSDLRRSGTESQSRFDEVRTALDAARARVAELEARLADHRIRAPFAGVLGLREVSPGSLVQPGERITTLDDIDRVKVDFSVPEAYLSILRPGLRVRTRSAAYPEREFVGEVRAVDNRIDPATRAVRVRAEIDNPDHALRPGMLLTLVLRANPERSLAIPEEALVPRGASQFVVLVDEQGATQRVEIRTGRRVPGIVEVRSGLEAGATIVIDGASLVPPGGMVRVLREEEPPPRV